MVIVAACHLDQEGKGRRLSLVSTFLGRSEIRASSSDVEARVIATIITEVVEGAPKI